MDELILDGCILVRAHAQGNERVLMIVVGERAPYSTVRECDITSLETECEGVLWHPSSALWVRGTVDFEAEDINTQLDPDGEPVLPAIPSPLAANPERVREIVYKALAVSTKTERVS